MREAKMKGLFAGCWKMYMKLARWKRSDGKRKSRTLRGKVEERKVKFFLSLPPPFFPFFKGLDLKYIIFFKR